VPDVSYPEGFDCIWIACDRGGRVGAFVTAGFGPIPLQVLGSSALPFDDIEARLRLLPRVASARLLVQLPRPDDFVVMAERGLFVFDWTDVHRPRSESVDAYELIAIPERPIALNVLREDIFPQNCCPVFDVEFADERWLRIEAYVPCRRAAP
jgi:hypothetical protein